MTRSFHIGVSVLSNSDRSVRDGRYLTMQFPGRKRLLSASSAMAIVTGSAVSIIKTCYTEAETTEESSSLDTTCGSTLTSSPQSNHYLTGCTYHHFDRPDISHTRQAAYSVMAADLTRATLVRNPECERNGMKSYVRALQKCASRACCVL